jgi:hypothetical protein
MRLAKKQLNRVTEYSKLSDLIETRWLKRSSDRPCRNPDFAGMEAVMFRQALQPEKVIEP